MTEENQSLSKEPYKGVRDFYPRDMYIQNFIFEVMRETAEEYGYIEYGASLLEPKELYDAKTGEEIVNEQTYTFEDRGGREVTLRPEMTPTLARMIANKYKELAFPIRWYSLPNLFRYERPQRGRLREHWQLNADIFGVASVDAEVEIITMAAALLKNVGASEQDFEIKISHRKLLDAFFENELDTDSATHHQLSKLLDKKEKMDTTDFKEAVADLIGDKKTALLSFLNTDSLEELTSTFPQLEHNPGVAVLNSLFKKLKDVGIHNIQFDPALVRGFDYYTGTVFEVFDTAEENRRSLFGGGRYDELLSIFDEEQIPAVGFGMGDVTFRDFLETHDLTPEYTSPTDVALCLIDEEFTTHAFNLAEQLRDTGLHVAVDISGKNVGTQIKNADAQAIPFIICIGQDEIDSGTLTVKNLSTGEEKRFENIESEDVFEELSSHILDARYST